jgi:type III pantothenate kinase
VNEQLLAIDVGNSQIAIGLGSGGAWRARWRIRTAPRRTADEHGILLRRMFALAGCRAADVGHVVISSVVPALTPVIGATCRTLTGREPLVVGPGVRTGMAVRYDPPSALGSDRLVDAVAARARFGAPVIVIDFGTATTFNVVDDDGAFVGGAIAPGVGVAAEALARAGARLRRIDLSPPNGMPAVGRDTVHSMRSGVLYGYAGLVEGILKRIDGELDERFDAPAPVVATGGMARRVAPLVERIDAVDPDLTLDGLWLIHSLNAA